MKFKDRLAFLFGYQKMASAKSPLDDFWYMPLGMQSDSGIDVTVGRAYQLAVVYACVRIISQTKASLPLILYRRTKDGGKERATDHHLYGLLHDNPNQYQTSYEWREMLSAHQELRGNAICEKIYDRKYNVIGLMPWNPDKVKLELLDNGNLRYTYRKQNGKETVRLKEDIVHFRGCSDDGFWGLSPIAMAKESIGLAIATERFGAKYFKNYAKPPIFLEHPGKLSEQAKDGLQRSVTEKYGGENIHSVGVVEEGMKVHELGIRNDEAQFLETRKYQAIDIGTRIFGVPPHMYGEMDRATFSNIEQQAIEFVMHTIRPRLVRDEQVLNRDLLENDKEYFFEYLVDGLLRGDAFNRAQSLQIQFQNGALNIDEWRSIENRNPLPNELGKKNYVQLNMTEVGKEPEPVVKSKQEEIKPKEENKKIGLFVNDAVERIANAECRELERKLPGLDDAAVSSFISSFYAIDGKHYQYVLNTIAPICQCLQLNNKDVASDICEFAWQLYYDSESVSEFTLNRKNFIKGFFNVSERN